MLGKPRGRRRQDSRRFLAANPAGILPGPLLQLRRGLPHDLVALGLLLAHPFDVLLLVDPVRLPLSASPALAARALQTTCGRHDLDAYLDPNLGTRADGTPPGQAASPSVITCADGRARKSAQAASSARRSAANWARL